MNDPIPPLERALLRYQNTYKIVATLQTDVCMERLFKLGPQLSRDQKVFEYNLYNLLNDVIKTAYEQGRKSLL
jgi:hypothetical protein